VADVAEVLSTPLSFAGHDQDTAAPLGIEDAVEILRRSGGFLADLEEWRVTALTEVYANYRRLAAAYVPARFEGNLVHFMATVDRPEGAPAAESGSPV